MRLQLDREWQLGERIGGGGFGQVYVAASDETAAVAKLIPKAPGADRELLFVDLSGVRNVVPIIDSGETEDHWILVMPRAQKSLRQHLEEAGGALDVPEAVSILIDIVTAVVDLDGRIVHRDLKPENVLLLGDRWCLADFGISRYAEATTAPDTQKYALSPPYAAPERWRTERATSAADVYAVGVIAFELLSGVRPFNGPSIEDYREQHLYDDPGSPSGVTDSLVALIGACLYKPPQARPSPTNLLARLQRLAQPASISPGLARLQEANREAAIRSAEAGRRVSQEQSERERRESLVTVATREWTEIRGALRDVIVNFASEVRESGDNLLLGQAKLWFTSARPTSSNPWGHRGAPVFDVLAYASIGVEIPADHLEYEGRSHSLWYCDAQTAGQYQWYETAFMISPILPRRSSTNPFALDPGEAAARALLPAITEYQVAWPFMVVSADDLSEFIDRWATWFAGAAQGRLQHPSTMPERQPTGSWRRS